MAYALGLPKDVTDRIYSMRDWRWEMVRDGGKAPSARCFNVGVPGVPWHTCEKPLLLPKQMPYYHVESDSEDSDFGEVVIDHWNRPPWHRGEVCIEQYYPANQFTLTKYGGGIPDKIRRLQQKLEKSTRDLWWQCEPCQ